ncbi:MAG: 4-(cytidine 5'-diphospho)-2-C-methyl-D-erythritol kinase [Paludibacteraceae bacterium]|nr:4-(cytidine 5'-diphospho)-2-C-methyl-D-erythritol kinase [Paludibacteraceae bacterium]
MTTYPNAKINLGLNITGQLANGYHTLSTVFLPVSLCDRLQIEPAESNQIRFHSSGLALDCTDDNNLIIKTYRMIQQLTGCNGADICFEKHIPFGAGLGGGSSDAAHTAIMLNELFNLRLTKDELKNIVKQMGADCPFFIDNHPSYAEGIGDILTPIELPQLKSYSLVIVKPDINVSTKEAYSGICPATPAEPLTEVVKRPVEEWKNLLFNDFETTIFTAHPKIGNIKKLLYDYGAVYASMSGSGAAVYGLFHKKETAEYAAVLINEAFVYTQQL